MCYRFILPIIVLLLACNGKNKEQDGTLTLYPLQNSHAIKDFSPYVESVEVIPLETTDSSLIANPSKIIITPEGNFVVNDASRILVFSPEGKFLFKIGKQGRGPREYLGCIDICISGNGKELLILDIQGHVLRHKLSDGTHVETVYLNTPEKYTSPYGVCPAPGEGFYIFFCNPDNDTDFENDFYCLLQFDKTGTNMAQYLPRKEYVLQVEMITQSFDSQYIIRPTSTDNIIYKTSEKGPYPFIKIDFEKKGMPHHLAMPQREEGFNLRNYMAAPYYKLPIYIHDTPDHLYFACCNPEIKNMNLLFNLKTGKGISWEYNPENDGTLFKIMASDRHYFYGLHDDYDNYDNSRIRQIKDPLKRYILQKTNLNLKNENQNPALIKLKFKS